MLRPQRWQLRSGGGRDLMAEDVGFRPTGWRLLPRVADTGRLRGSGVTHPAVRALVEGWHSTDTPRGAHEDKPSVDCVECSRLAAYVEDIHDPSFPEDAA